MRRSILTIGHSNHSLEVFAKLLIDYGVDTVVDIRSAPYSRFNPQFNREQLMADLRNHRMGYLFLGNELGGRSNDPSHYKEGRVLYSSLAGTKFFRQGLELVSQNAAEHRIVLMCSEGEPLACHRTLLVARFLVDNYGLAVEHILPDGQLESYSDSINRLLVNTDLLNEDLFLSRQERIARAINCQERRVAYNHGKPNSVNEGLEAR